MLCRYGITQRQDVTEPLGKELSAFVFDIPRHNLREYDDSRFSVPITWDDLQAIKDRFWPDQIAVEVFPPRSSIVNIADLRWIWCFRRGASLPLNLQASSINVLRS